MPQGGQWVMENHSRASISHNLTNLLAHCGGIAVSRALRAECLILLIRAIVTTLKGVIG